MLESTRLILLGLPLVLAGAGSGCKDSHPANPDADVEESGPDVDGDLEALDLDAREDGLEGDMPQGDADPETPDLDVLGDPWEGIDGELSCREAPDADGDTILDTDEGEGDTDGDTVPNRNDGDSDGDGRSDALEAGDGDPCTTPVNSDFDPSRPVPDDGRPDFLDTDSDNDGLSDANEAALGTDPTEPDSDGDDVTDLLEVAAGADPLDPLSTFPPDVSIVLLPFLEPEQRLQLAFDASLRIADIYFLIDTTGTMDPAVSSLASGLTVTVMPSLLALVPDLQIGIGHFNDFPTPNFGDASDMPYWHDVDITDNFSLVQGAIDTYPYSTLWGNGNDTPESNVVALYLAASGSGLDAGGAALAPRACPSYPDEPGPREGFACFRPLAQPILVHVSDAPWHNGPAPVGYPYDFDTVDYTDAINAMSTLRARHVGVFVNSYGTEGLPYMEAASQDTGTVDELDDPLVIVSDVASVADSVVSLIDTLTTSTPQNVRALPRDCQDDPGPGPLDFDATLFVEVPIRTFAAFPPDGYPSPLWDEEVFYDTFPGTELIFDVTFYNGVVPEADIAQLFKVFITIQGNGRTRLDERLVIIIVPNEGMII